VAHNDQKTTAFFSETDDLYLHSANKVIGSLSNLVSDLMNTVLLLSYINTYAYIGCFDDSKKWSGHFHYCPLSKNLGCN